jgi:YVTN family beta-propeller protein
MSKLRSASVAAVILVAVGGMSTLGARSHMLTMSGRKDLSGVKNCWTCHFQPESTDELPWAKPRPHHAAPAGLVLSPDGKLLYVALDDLDEVAVVDTVTRLVARKAKVTGGPTGLALDPTGRRLYVTCRSGDRVASLDTATLGEVGSAAVGTSPVGIVYVEAEGNPRLVVANSGSDDITVLSAEPLANLGHLASGREPYAVSLAPGGKRALIASRMAGLARGDEVPAAEVTVVDPAAIRVVSRERIESGHLSEGITIVPGRPWALVPILKVRNLVPITHAAQGWVLSAGLALSDPSKGTVVEIPLDETNAYYSDPSGIAVDPSAKRAFIASAGANVVTVVDLDRIGSWLEGAGEAERQGAIDDLQLSSEFVVARIPTGHNPRTVAMSPDGKTLWVAERLQDSILAVDTASLKPLGRVTLGDGGDADPIRRGERVFARATTTFQGQFSCRSCHPDGHVDGLQYDFDIDGVGRDILDNRSLQGLAGTEPFKWNGKNPSLRVQCGPRFAKVLTRSDPFSEKDLDDLDSFIFSLPPTRVPSSGPWTEAQKRGRDLFFATKTPDGREIPYGSRCSTCHRPPLYTDRIPADVGTKGPADNTTYFDTPHLLGIAASAPYLHDGRAATLEEIWTIYNPKDQHGVTNSMNKIQLNDLIEYLKRL